MADSDKNILITPATGTAGNPNITFTGFNNSSVSAIVQDDGTIIFEGAAGELMSISNSDDGTLFTANNLSGIAMIETNDSDVIAIAHNGTDKLGVGTDSPTEKLTVSGNVAVTGNISINGSDVQTQIDNKAGAGFAIAMSIAL